MLEFVTNRWYFKEKGMIVQNFYNKNIPRRLKMLTAGDINVRLFFS